MTHELDHPLLHMLRRISAAGPNIRMWSSHWAEANLVPVLRDIRAAMDRAELTLDDLQQFVRPLQAALAQRDDTKELAELPDRPGLLMGGNRLPQVVPLDRRIPNEIRTAVDRVIEELKPAPAVPAAPKPPAAPTEKPA